MTDPKFSPAQQKMNERIQQTVGSSDHSVDKLNETFDLNEKSPNQFSKLWIKTPDQSPDTMAPLGASTNNSEKAFCLNDQKAQKMYELL